MSRQRSLNRNWPLFLITLSLNRVALAESLDCAQDSLCRSHLDQGVAHDQAGKYEAALREFQAAYQQNKDPRVAANIGRTLHKLGRFSESLSWYKEAGRAAPGDTVLQKELQAFSAQARQNLPLAAAAPTSVTVVNSQPILVQPATVNVTPVAINSSNIKNVVANDIKIDLGSLGAVPASVEKPLYQRAVLWVPLIGVALAASAVGIASAYWPRAWQPEPQIPSSVFSAITAGGVK